VSNKSPVLCMRPGPHPGVAAPFPIELRMPTDLLPSISSRALPLHNQAGGGRRPPVGVINSRLVHSHL
jgi:hypothetical protein